MTGVCDVVKWPRYRVRRVRVYYPGSRRYVLTWEVQQREVPEIPWHLAAFARTRAEARAIRSRLAAAQ